MTRIFMLNSATVKIQYCTICKTNLKECELKNRTKMQEEIKMQNDWIKEQVKAGYVKDPKSMPPRTINPYNSKNKHDSYCIEMTMSLTDFEWACENIWIEYNLELKRIKERINSENQDYINEALKADDLQVKIMQDALNKSNKKSWWKL